MIILLGISVLELICLFFLGKRFTQSLFISSFHMTGSRSMSITILTLFLFPGTVVHELSHLFTAEILGVRTGELSLVPESIQGEDGITSGSVAIAHTDPFRRAMIGVAPLVSGIIILAGISYFLPLWITTFSREPAFLTSLPLIGAFYGILTVSTTMFSSPEDMHGVVPVIVIILLLVTGSYIAGLKIQLPEMWNVKIYDGMLALVKALGMVITIHAVVILLRSLPGLVMRKKRYR